MRRPSSDAIDLIKRNWTRPDSFPRDQRRPYFSQRPLRVPLLQILSGLREGGEGGVDWPARNETVFATQFRRFMRTFCEFPPTRRVTSCASGVKKRSHECMCVCVCKGRDFRLERSETRRDRGVFFVI